MGECTYASITIGGQLNSNLIPELTDLLLESNLICDSIRNPVSVLPKKFNLLGNLNAEKILFFDTSEADEGEFPKLEEWLRAHNLPYARESQTCINERDGTTIPHRAVFWIPGLEDPRTIINDMGQQHLVHVGEVEWILSAMSSVGSIEEAPKFINHGDVHEKAFAAYILQQNKYDPIGYLQKHLKEYYAIPTLPAFRIQNNKII